MCVCVCVCVWVCRYVCLYMYVGLCLVPELITGLFTAKIGLA